jgi:hypothetical protein
LVGLGVDAEALALSFATEVHDRRTLDERLRAVELFV